MSAEQNTKKRGMTLKEFFKSTAFKCIIVLLAIVLICGILLTICNTLFEVTDEERAERDRQSLLENIVSIYGSETDIEVVDTTDLETEFSNGTISSVYLTSDGNYIVNATGTGGFSSGTVTCWVVVLMTDGAVSGIGNVTIASNTSQSWINKVPDEALEYFGENYESYESNGSFAVSDIRSEGLTGGATYSTTAIVNAVNTALEFVRSQLAGEEIIDKYADFVYTDYIDTNSTNYEVDGSTVTYSIVTTNYGYAGAFSITVVVGENGVISAYEITENGSTYNFNQYMDESILDGTMFVGKNANDISAIFSASSEGTFDIDDLTDSSLSTGSTYSNFLCVYAALFATSNYDIAVGGEA